MIGVHNCGDAEPATLACMVPLITLLMVWKLISHPPDARYAGFTPAGAACVHDLNPIHAGQTSIICLKTILDAREFIRAPGTPR